MKKKVVVLTGAGISAESGLKTFRDSDGLWEGYSIEEVATIDAWYNNPELVLDFYNMRRRAVLEAKPNAAHFALAEWEKEFDMHIITQNIDDLHERAGSSKVLHLHGEILKACSEKNTQLTIPWTTDMNWGDKAPDGAQLRPFVVWFGEPVPKMSEAFEIVSQADAFVVIGTSLVVYPAAGLAFAASRHIPRIVLDRKIPQEILIEGHLAIEKPATEGIRDVYNVLREKLN